MGFLAVATGERAELEVKTMARRLSHRVGGRLSPDWLRISKARIKVGRGARPIPAVLVGTRDGGVAPSTSTPSTSPSTSTSSSSSSPGSGKLLGLLHLPMMPGVPELALPEEDLPDSEPSVVYCDGHPPDAFALAAAWDDGPLLLARGLLGLRPLYYLERDGQPVAFASEMKALCPLGEDIRTFPPGHAFINGRFVRLTSLSEWGSKPLGDPGAAARELVRLVEEAVKRGYQTWLEALADTSGAEKAPVAVFLSGGIDSSVVAAAAASVLGRGKLLSFAVGTRDSQDLPWARLVAQHLGIRHIQKVFGEDDVNEVLPDVIYHLESFDPPLVRSSVANYLVAGMAAEAGCRLAYCGEGGDELFAGYSYLKNIKPRDRVARELITLLETGHANGFQRVDRMMSAFGLEARVPLSAPDLVAFAMRVPVEWKLHPDTGQEKWLLRQAFRDRLPRAIVERPKAKFYEGSGIQGLMARVADARISDAEFERGRDREVEPGLVLETKEKMLYYRIFREHFPHRSLLETIGWTRTVQN